MHLEMIFGLRKGDEIPTYLVYLSFALNVNCASVQFIHNKVTIINHFKILVLFYMNAHVPFLQHSSIEIEMN